MIRLRTFAGLASLLFALSFVTLAHAQTGTSGTGTTNDPNATNQTQTTDQYNTQSQVSPNDQTAGTGTGTYPATTNDYDRDRGPDLGWLGLLGLVGLLGLKRRNVHHSREDEVRGGRPATV